MINELLKQATNDEVKWWITYPLTKYQKGERPLTLTEAEHIIDYLNSKAAPKRFQKMSVEDAKRKAEEWTASLRKKGNDVIETEADVKGIVRFRSSGLRLVKLLSEASYKREGFLMRHCVASYYGKENVEIYSLRDANNEPHCTIEVQKNGNGINQIKGKGNGSIHPKYVGAVLLTLKRFGMEVRDSEMKNLGYASPSKEYWELLESEGVKTKYVSFKGKKYLYLGE